MQSHFAQYAQHQHFQPLYGGLCPQSYHALQSPHEHYSPFDFSEQQQLAMPSLVLQPYGHPQPVTFPPEPLAYEDASYVHDFASMSAPVQSTPLIHSPIPVSAYSTLLAHVQRASQESTTSSPHSQPEASHVPSQVGEHSHPAIIRLSPAPQHALPFPTSSVEVDEDTTPRSTLEEYCAQQVTFPTPSELLSNLAQNEAGPASVSEHSAQAPTVEVTDASPSPSRDPTPPAQRVPKAKSRAKVPTVLQPAQPGRPENLRKSYFRSVADNVGFQPTDPDTITSHDKKRHYLESLEQYILWLHDQIGLSGHTPLQLERVDSHRGLNSRSIRTMLVHMQNQTRKLHQQVVCDEEKYFESERRALSQPPEDMQVDTVQAAYLVPPERPRRHSIANGMIPMCAASHIPPLPTAMPLSHVPPPPTAALPSHVFVSGAGLAV